MDKFTLAEIGEIKEKQDEYHRVTTNTVVRGLLPLSKVEAPWWR